MKYYVTLFDSNYLTRGLVMYQSLLQHGGNFHLWIICFDNLAYELLDNLRLEKVTLVSLSEFEDEELLRIKLQRTRQEYCWTCTPSVALYVLNTEPHVDAITYLDADLMFFSSPEPIFIEAENAAILLTEHRYLPKIAQFATNGIYNVQFMMFRRELEGLQALNWWRERCLEWCFARFEDGKYGDQKYLDDWPVRFSRVHVVQHLGTGLAPWNAAQYFLQKIEGQIYVEGYPLIFYHFHGFKLHPFRICHLSSYPITADMRYLIYQQYLQKIVNAYKQIRNIKPKFNCGIIDFPKPPKESEKLYVFVKQIIKDIIKGRFCRYV